MIEVTALIIPVKIKSNMAVSLEVDEIVEGKIGGGEVYQVLYMHLMDEGTITVNALDIVASLESGEVYVALGFWMYREKVKALLLCTGQEPGLLLVKDDVYDIILAKDEDKAKHESDIDFESVTTLIETASNVSDGDKNQIYDEYDRGLVYFTAKDGFHRRVSQLKLDHGKNAIPCDPLLCLGNDDNPPDSGKITESPEGLIDGDSKPAPTNQLENEIDSLLHDPMGRRRSGRLNSLQNKALSNLGSEKESTFSEEDEEGDDYDYSSGDEHKSVPKDPDNKNKHQPKLQNSGKKTSSSHARCSNANDPAFIKGTREYRLRRSAIAKKAAVTRAKNRAAKKEREIFYGTPSSSNSTVSSCTDTPSSYVKGLLSDISADDANLFPIAKKNCNGSLKTREEKENVPQGTSSKNRTKAGASDEGKTLQQIQGTLIQLLKKQDIESKVQGEIRKLGEEIRRVEADCSKSHLDEQKQLQLEKIQQVQNELNLLKTNIIIAQQQKKYDVDEKQQGTAAPTTTTAAQRTACEATGKVKSQVDAGDDDLCQKVVEKVFDMIGGIKKEHNSDMPPPAAKPRVPLYAVHSQRPPAQRLHSSLAYAPTYPSAVPPLCCSYPPGPQVFIVGYPQHSPPVRSNFCMKRSHPGFLDPRRRILPKPQPCDFDRNYNFFVDTYDEEDYCYYGH